jgi:putative endonuclease
VTSDLVGRIWQHQNGIVEGFSKKDHCRKLVWYEVHDRMETAITREKQIKEWQRIWKLRIIEEMNPDWDDLYETLF